MPILGPKHSSEHPDRLTHCEEALEAELNQFIDRAICAGWSEDEICTALTSLADHRVLSLLANADLRRRIASVETGGIVLRRTP
ncbi:hypothetical protein WMC41_30605 (plasmid) [Shinella yambaruensis]|uniref:hypothetical protein n=1 Tax=Shinella yambaruensis TaxID=415996 RepID=UPI003D7BE857